MEAGREGAANRVIRGGSWNDDARNVRSACRNDDDPANRNDNVGFRCAQVRGWVGDLALEQAGLHGDDGHRNCDGGRRAGRGEDRVPNARRPVLLIAQVLGYTSRSDALTGPKNMNLTLLIPDDLGERLSAGGADLARRALEAFAAEEYGAGRLTRAGTPPLAGVLIAVGTRITARPPHRTVRAAFPHTAPTVGV